MVTMRPCFLSSSIAFLVRLSLILLLERLMIRRKGILGRLSSSAIMASSVRRLKERFRLVTWGITSKIFPKPSLLSLFFTSFSPFTFLMGFRQSRMSQIFISLREQPVRSSVSKLSRQQNYSMMVPTLLRQGVETVFTDDRLSIRAPSLDVLLFLGVGETATRYGVRWSAPNSIFTDFLTSYFSSRAVRTSCWTKPSSSKEELSSRRTLMQLKTELAMVGFYTILIWDIRVSMVEMLLLILVYRRCKRESPSLQIYRGPSQYITALSYILCMPYALSNNSLHFTSHNLYLFCESFSSLISVVILAQMALKFFTTSSQAFFSASFTFSAMMANFLLISDTSLSFSLPIFVTIFSLNSSLLILESRATFLALQVWNWRCLLSVTCETQWIVLNLWSL